MYCTTNTKPYVRTKNVLHNNSLLYWRTNVVRIYYTANTTYTTQCTTQRTLCRTIEIPPAFPFPWRDAFRGLSGAPARLPTFSRACPNSGLVMCNNVQDLTRIALGTGFRKKKKFLTPRWKIVVIAAISDNCWYVICKRLICTETNNIEKCT